MAKKKDEAVQTTALEAGPVSAAPVATPVVADIVVADVDFNELLELEKAVKQTADQFDKIAGNIERLKRDLDLFHNHERTINTQIESKRKELVKRYQIDEKRQWRIDFTSHKVVYVG